MFVNIRTLGLAIFVLALTFSAFPAQCHPDALPMAKAADLPGLTVAQSLRIDGPDARRALGFPAAASMVLRQAEQGNALAMAVISSAYAAGAGVPQSDIEAQRWGMAAVESGLPFAYYVLAKQYELANVPNYPEAERNYWLASDLGHVPAKRELALFIMRGHDTYRSKYSLNRDGEPRQLLDDAADAGDIRAATLREAWNLNEEFTQIAQGGMPLLFQQRVSYVHISKVPNPCVTDLFTTKNQGVYRIDWTKSTTEMRSVTNVAVKGAVFTLWNGQGYVGLQLLLLENNDKYTPAQTRAMFQHMFNIGQALGQACNGL